MQRQEAVQRAMRGHAISQRRACVLVGVAPKTARRERSPDNSVNRPELPGDGLVCARRPSPVTLWVIK